MSTGNKEWGIPMLYILVPIVILLALVKRKSNWVFFGTLFLIWILLGWSFGNADYSIYIGRFNNYEVNSMFTEVLYTELMLFANRLGFTYQQFLPVMMLFHCFVIGLLSKTLSKAPAFVLALYLVFPACMDAVQIRYTLAGSLVLLGMYFLLNADSKKGEIIYTLCVVVAMLIHVSTIVFLMFIPVKHFDYKKTIIYTAIVSIIVSLSHASFLIRIISRLPRMGDKIGRVLSTAANKYTQVTIFKTFFRVVVFFVMFMAILYYVRTRLKKKKITEGNAFLNNIVKLNIMSLMILSLLTYSVDFYRIQQTLSLLNYCALSYFFITIEKQTKKKRFVISRNAMVYEASCLLMSFINLYYLVLNSNNINTVFKPFFENNIFFSR